MHSQDSLKGLPIYQSQKVSMSGRCFLFWRTSDGS